MEDQQPGLFSFSIDEYAQSTLVSIAKWNRFMAWVGIILCSVFIIALVLGGNYFFSTFMRPRDAEGAAVFANGSVFFISIYVVLSAICLVPCFFRLSFSNKMLKAIAGSDQELLNESLKQLKTYSMYWGVLTIVGVGFYLLIFMVFIIAFLAGGMRR